MGNIFETALAAIIFLLDGAFRHDDETGIWHSASVRAVIEPLPEGGCEVVYY